MLINSLSLRKEEEKKKMRGHLLLITDHPEDLRNFQTVYGGLSLQMTRTLAVEEIKKLLSQGGKIIAFWNTENAAIYEKIKSVLHQYLEPGRIIGYSNHSFMKKDLIPKYPLVGNHLQLSTSTASRLLYPRVADALLQNEGLGVEKYFAQNIEIRSLKILRSKQKVAVIEAIQNVMNSKGVVRRLATLVAQSVDELILNAMLKAPTDRQVIYLNRAGLEKNEDFELEPRGVIEIRVGNNDDYWAISVKDQYGSFTRTALNQALQLNPRAGIRAQIGLSRLLQAGLSLLITSVPNTSTEVTLFFKAAGTYKDYKNEPFQFFCTALPLELAEYSGKLAT
jgi:hypothetical protein